MRSIRTMHLTRQYPEALDYIVQLEQSEDMRFHVRAGLVGAESDRAPQGLAQQDAEDLFQRIVQARQAEGFVDAQAPQQTSRDAQWLSPTPSSSPNPTLSAISQALLKRLHPDVWRILPANKRSRLVWQIGEYRITQAAPQLLTLFGSHDNMLDYCLCWALGRCGDVRASGVLNDLRQNGRTEAIKRMATLAWLNLADDATRQAHADALIADWPALLRDAWATQDEAQCTQVTLQAAAWQRITLNDWLEQLDQIAQASQYATLARSLLLKQLTQMPMQFGTFRAIRRLYKAAEFRNDIELFGILHERFEDTKEAMWHKDFFYINKRYVKFKDAVQLADSGIAYTNRTKAYMRRRTWRTLRRLGRAQDPAFVPMAVGVLQAFQDAHARNLRTDPNRIWDRQQRAWIEHPRYYNPYSSWMLFNKLLHVNSERWQSSRDGSTFWSNQEAWNDKAASEYAIREEAYPQLWDQQPQALLWLMQHSRCAGVHNFAARALADNTAFCATLTAEQIRTLMQSEYPATLRFAFSHVRDRIINAKDIGQPSDQSLEWLLLLVSTPLEEARHFALEHISANPSHYASSARLIVTMLCAPDDGVRKLARLLCEAAKSRFDTPEQIIEQIFSWLEGCENWSGPLAEITDNLRWTLQNPLSQDAARADYDRIVALFSHPCANVISLAADWLLLHRHRVSKLPPDTLRRLLQTDDPEICSAGVRLFGALPESVLLSQPALFASFCMHPQAAVRAAIMPVLEQLARTRPSGYDKFVEELIPHLLDTLFRSETNEGMHADVLSILEGSLSTQTRKLDAATHLRLMTAQSKGAQQLGAWLLPERKPTDFSVRDWAALARTPVLVIREWACQCYRDNIPIVLAHMEDALRIFDSRWDDALLFACDFFKEHGQWTPALLISLCDHSNPTVQNAGRELIVQHADLQDVVEYLLKLSQHPSASIQLLVSDWLQKGVDNDIGRLRQLRPYFLSVLSQVNRSRQVKNHVLDFLRQQAMQSEDAASFVAEVFARQVVTVAITDKSQYLEGLQEIRSRYPQLASPLLIQPPRQHTPVRS